MTLDEQLDAWRAKWVYEYQASRVREEDLGDGIVTLEQRKILEETAKQLGPSSIERAIRAALTDLDAAKARIAELEAQLAKCGRARLGRPGHHPPCKAMFDSEACCTCGQ